MQADDPDTLLFERALEACDSEPVHIPGRIQPHGALLAADLRLTRITHVSANIAEHLGIAPEAVLRARPDDLLSREICHALRNVSGMADAIAERHPVGRLVRDGRPRQLFAFRCGPSIAIEIEPDPLPDLADPGLNAKIAFLTERVNRHTDEQALLEDVVKWLRTASGYDRVMAYRFAADWSGEVVAEARRPDLEPHLGTRFPSWDIPRQARELMRLLSHRCIADVAAVPVPVLAADPGAPPLDMSLGFLRATSPVHIQYLRNMGTGATLTFSLVVNGRLWGNLSLHHMSARVPEPALRALCVPFARYLSLKLALIGEVMARESRDAVRAILHKIEAAQDAGAELSHLITDEPARIMELFDACGVAITSGETVTTFGKTLPVAHWRGLAGGGPGSRGAVAFEALGRETDLSAEARGTIAGLMIVPLNRGNLAAIFRHEMAEEVTWAGPPRKDLTLEQGQPRLSPRGSFALYRETVRGRSRPWRPIDFELADGLADIVMRSDFRTAIESSNRQQELMINELNHRVRNMLALIRSVSRQARRHNASLSSYAAALEKRIKALAIAHDLSTGKGLVSTSVRSVILTEAEPFVEAGAGGTAVTITGDDVAIRAINCPIFALAIHEITTNAAKYGALSCGGGRVAIELRLGEDGLCMRWRESGGPPVSPPDRRGFGTTLIENAIPFEFDGHVSLDFRPEGVSIDIFLPNAVLEREGTDPPCTPGGPRTPVAAEPPPRRFSGRVLLVEDHFVIANDMETMLLGLGFEQVEVVANIRDALAALAHLDCDAAVLDINLSGCVSLPVAQELVDRETPFVFATGYGSDIAIPAELSGVPVVTKPVDASDLAAALDRALRDRAGG